MVRIEPTAEASLAAMRARSKFGIAMAAMIKIIATTINNSMSEKPFCFLFMSSLSLGKLLKSLVLPGGVHPTKCKGCATTAHAVYQYVTVKYTPHYQTDGTWFRHASELAISQNPCARANS